MHHEETGEVVEAHAQRQRAGLDDGLSRAPKVGAGTLALSTSHMFRAGLETGASDRT